MSVEIRIGNIVIGGNNPIAVQSMTTTDTRDVESTLRQIKRLEEAGADLVRIAVPDEESVRAIPVLKSEVGVPIVADIHFDHRLAIKAIEAGVDKVRINPGNIGSRWKVEELAKVAEDAGVPIRVGANTGSLPKDLERYEDRAEALAEAALREVRAMESVGFHRIVVSAKSPDVRETIRANEYISERIDYPIHLGVTEAGTYETATVKSSVALGYLLLEGIGDTIRVSISGDPVREVSIARKILSSIHLREEPEVVACPMCSRAVFDVERIAREVEDMLKDLRIGIRVSILGCYVNGIGEGRHSDVGIAGIDRERFVAFKRGKILGEYKMKDLRRVLNELIREFTSEETLPHGKRGQTRMGPVRNDEPRDRRTG